MTNDELQTAIDSLLSYLVTATGNAPIVVPTDALKLLLEIQVGRGKQNDQR